MIKTAARNEIYDKIDFLKDVIDYEDILQKVKIELDSWALRLTQPANETTYSQEDILKNIERLKERVVYMNVIKNSGFQVKNLIERMIDRKARIISADYVGGINASVLSLIKKVDDMQIKIENSGKKGNFIQINEADFKVHMNYVNRLKTDFSRDLQDEATAHGVSLGKKYGFDYMTDGINNQGVVNLE